MAGPLFITQLDKPLTRAYFSVIFKSCLIPISVKADEYNTHSFCVGAASWAAMKGMSESQIKEMGLWQSNAYKKYIRIGTMMLSHV